MPGCPIRKPADQVVCADPRGLSQLVASFLASGSLGIPRVPLFTFFRLLLLLPSSRLPPSCPCIAAWTDFLCPLFYILFFPNMSKNSCRQAFCLPIAVNRNQKSGGRVS